MTGSLGYGLVLGALAFATVGGVVGTVGGLQRRDSAVRFAFWGAIGFFACMLGANLAMEYALLTNDFSIRYVAQVGSIATPRIYSAVSLWSALEGSILFWGLILGSFLLAFALVHRKDPPRAVAVSLGVMLLVGIFFSFLIAGPANPFHAVPNPLADGPGPNPLLQNHVLMIVHPPMLYLGYVGMTVPFGVAVAGLLRGEISEAWMAPLRRWTMLAWIFLSIGIILGAWWAYAVLGWGGYWAWDPVENASFLPWLTATAFMHSTMVQERKRILKLWTLSLALASFVLTILGTFMTRSGVFNSVHSFTQSDIGPTFLVFLAVLLVGCVVLIASRGHLLAPEDQIRSPLSRETSILVNNLLFVAVTFTVLIGTIYPLISEALRGVRVSVGEPYFNKMAVPGGLAVLFLMGVGPVLPWGSGDPKRVRTQLLVPTGVGLAIVGICLAAGLRGVYPLTAFGLAGFVTVVTLREMFLPAWIRKSEKGESLFTALYESISRARRRFGGYVVHLGIVAIIVAVSASSSFVSHASGTLTDGQQMTIGEYQVKFVGMASGKEPHRDWVAARVEVTDAAGKTIQMAPRMNYYESMTDPVGTPSVHSGPGEDLYLSLLAFSADRGSASFNAWVFPLVGWIWWSIPILVLGTTISLWPSRRRKVSLAGAEKKPEGGEGALGERGAA